MSRAWITASSRRRRFAVALVVLAASAIVAACGSSSSADGQSSHGGGNASLPFPRAGGGGQICTKSQLSHRIATIVHRPSGLSLSRPVPLLIALHGSGGGPINMEGLSHFEHVADEHGFVVAYPGSCDETRPWADPRDTAYIGSLITNLTRQQNIDPKRVFVAGYSAGGYETWRAACLLSKQVAAVAIVSGAMNGQLYESCRLSKPLAQLLIVGTADSSRWTGVPKRLPSAVQTTAHWRALDHCASTPVHTTQAQGVTQQLWTSCAGGSAVGLYAVHGAHHVWPPYGPNAPQNYPTSEVVWSFLAAHPAP